MSEKIVINATRRNDQGKGASRRLRRQAGLMPAIIYGGNEPPVMISLPQKDMMKATENEAVFSSILDVNVDGQPVPAILKDLQRHPAKPVLLHADFQRVDQNTRITVHVPLHFIHEDICHGVKLQGGRIQHNLVELEISCLPSNLPEYIEVDMTDAKLGDILHISDLKLGEGVESVALAHGPDHDLPVVAVVAPKGGAEESEAAAETGGPAA